MRIDLLPKEYRPQPQVRAINLFILLGGLALIVGAAYFVWNEYTQNQTMNFEFSRYEKQYNSLLPELQVAEANEKIVNEMKQKQQEINKIIDLYQPNTDLLRNISGALPNDVWFNKVTVEAQGKISVIGAAVLFPLIGNYLTELNQLEIITSSRLVKIEKKTEETAVTYIYNIEMQTGRSSLEYAKK